MKVVFGLFGFLALVGIALFYFGGLSGYDPAQQAAEFKAAVKTGQTWQQVLDTRAPKTFATLDYSNQHSFDGRSSSRDFNEDAFRDTMQKNNGQHPSDGFIFEYVFDTEHAYDLYFDPAGNLTSIEDAITANDLLNGGMGD